MTQPNPQGPVRVVPSFADVEAMAEAWSDRPEVQTMVETVTGVFSKWASPEIMSRFRQQMMALVQQGYAEGYIAAPSPAAPEGVEGVPWSGDDERWDQVTAAWQSHANEHLDESGRIDVTEVDTCVAIALHRAFMLNAAPPIPLADEGR